MSVQNLLNQMHRYSEVLFELLDSSGVLILYLS